MYINQDLRQERSAIVDEMKAMLDRAESQNRDLNAAEAKDYAAKEKQIDSLAKRIERSERVDAEVAYNNQIIGSVPRAPVGDSSDRQRMGAVDTAAMARFFRTGDTSSFQNSLSIGTDSEGGFTISEQFDRDLFASIAEVNPVFRDVERVTTPSDNFVRIYTDGGADSGRVAENATRTETTGPSFAKVKIPLSMLYANVYMSEEVLLASDYDLMGHVRREVEIAFDSNLESDLIAGDGAGVNPTGILTAADSTDGDAARAFGSYQLVSGASTDAVSYDEIVGLLHSLPPRYRRNAKLYASTEVIQAMRLLKDTANLPLWRDTDGGAGRPQTFLGVEVVEVPSMPGFGASEKTLIYGDLSQGYAFASHQAGTQWQRDPYTTPGIVKAYVRLYCGGSPTDTKAVKVFQQAAS
jgi:HK97 family phage major capsid protein